MIGTSTITVSGGLEISNARLQLLFGDGHSHTVTSSDAKQTLKFEPEPQGWMQDRPLGARLLLCMADGYRDKMLQVWDSDKTRTEKIAVRFAAPVRGTDWMHALGGALLSRHSLPSIACNFADDQPLYAVATSVMMITQGVVVDNVSILPVSAEWLALALTCMSLEPPLPLGIAELDEQLDQAEVIAQRIQTLALRYDAGLVQDIDRLLLPYCRSHKNGLKLENSGDFGSATVAEDD
eukprot:SAG31_NODE_16419_length_710_cov_0.779051_1_plen_236_part_11